MTTFDFLFRKIRHVFSNKKNFFYLLVTIVLLLVLFSLLKACSKPIANHSVYRVGLDTQWDLINFMGKERNITAFSNELLQTISKNENITIQLSSYSSDELLGKLENGTVDAILSSIRPEFPMRATFAFSHPYFLLGPVLVIAKNSSLNKNELSHKIVGVQTNSSTALELQKNSTIQIRLYDNILPALSDLANQQIDGTIFPVIPSYVYTNTFFPDQFKIATPPLTDEGLRLITLQTKKGEHLIQLFNKGLATIQEDGTYDNLIEKWNLVNTSKIDETSNESINQANVASFIIK